MNNSFRTGNMHAAKLTFEDVRKIRGLYAEGWSQGRLAREFNVSLNQIGKIVRREAWQTLPKTSEELKQDARTSLEKFKQMNPGLIPDEPPPTGLTKLQEVAKKAGEGDRMLDELMQSGGERKPPVNPLDE